MSDEKESELLKLADATFARTMTTAKGEFIKTMMGCFAPDIAPDVAAQIAIDMDYYFHAASKQGEMDGWEWVFYNNQPQPTQPPMPDLDRHPAILSLDMTLYEAVQFIRVAMGYAYDNNTKEALALRRMVIAIQRAIQTNSVAGEVRTLSEAQKSLKLAKDSVAASEAALTEMTAAADSLNKRNESLQGELDASVTQNEQMQKSLQFLRSVLEDALGEAKMQALIAGQSEKT